MTVLRNVFLGRVDYCDVDDCGCTELDETQFWTWMFG